MDINEAFRRIVSGHLKLLAVLVVLPLIVVFELTRSHQTLWSASSRIQASASSVGSDTEADSILNRVQGIATSPAIVQQAITTSQVPGRSTRQLIDNEITVTRIGSSAVMDVTVTDRNPHDARALARALGSAVVGFISGDGQRQSQSLIATLTAQSKQLLAQRQSLTAALDRATIQVPQNIAATVNLSSQLSSVDQQLADLTATVQQLQVAVVTSTSASVISAPGPATRASTSGTTEVVLAGLAGLVGGLIIASIIEVVRPRVADGRTFARELGVPLLGRIKRSRRRRFRLVHRRLFRLARRRPTPAGADGGALDQHTLAVLRWATHSAGVHTLVLASAGGYEPNLARQLTEQFAALLPVTANGQSNGHKNGHKPGGSKFVVPDSPPFQRSGRVATVKPPQRVRTARAEVPLRVILPDELDLSQPPTDHGLLVVARRLAPAARLEQIRDLAAATRWPVIGVLDDRVTTRRRASETTS